MRIEEKMKGMGLYLPPPPVLPPGLSLPFAWARTWGDRVAIAGHGPQRQDGSIAGPFGKVGTDVSPEEAYDAARLTALSVLGSLQREIGDLDRIAAWMRVEGFINTAPGFIATTNVINGFSDLIVELFGEEVGRHARFAIGVAALPFNIPVEIAAEVALRS